MEVPPDRWFLRNHPKSGKVPNRPKPCEQQKQNPSRPDHAKVDDFFFAKNIGFAMVLGARNDYDITSESSFETVHAVLFAGGDSFP